MKKSILVFVLIFLCGLFLSSAPILAEEVNSVTSTIINLEDNRELIEPSILPDSPFYFIELLKEKMIIWFTFGPEKEIEKYWKFAELRMAEYQKMIDNGKTETAQKVLERYGDTVQKILDKVEELKNEQKGILKFSQKAEQILSKHTVVLEKNLDKVPEQARDSLMRAIIASKKSLNKVLDYQNKEFVEIEEEAKSEEKSAEGGSASGGKNQEKKPEVNTEIKKEEVKIEQKESEKTPKTYNVRINNSAYVPKTIKVKSGDTIQWTNNDKSSHTITSVRGLFNSGTIQTGGQWSYKVKLSKGVYEYYCAIHLEKMARGIIEVE